jgi:hypothetical protein
MNSRDDVTENHQNPSFNGPSSSRKEPDTGQILEDLRAGFRTRHFLATYGLSMQEFEIILKDLIRKGLFTKEEYKTWKSHRVAPKVAETNFPAPPGAQNISQLAGHKTVSTYVIPEPEKNNSWALQLFSTDRNRMAGAGFKVVLHGKKYAFVVERLLFRGPVDMVRTKAPRPRSKEKREQAMDFIAKYGWAAYLENRAYAANFDEDGMREAGKARLVLLHCRNDTFVAALHTPAPAINLYVGSSLESIRERLARNIDTSQLNF